MPVTDTPDRSPSPTDRPPRPTSRTASPLLAGRRAMSTRVGSVLLSALTAVAMLMGAASTARATPATGAGTAPPGQAASSTTGTAKTAGNYQIINRWTGKCLTPWGSGDGTAVTQITCRSGNADQLWRLDSGSVGAIANVGTGKCLDLWGNMNSDGQLVFTWSCYGAASQRWKPVDRGGQYFELRPYSTDKCLDIASGNTSDGAVVQQWGCLWLGNDHQQWRLS